MINVHSLMRHLSASSTAGYWTEARRTAYTLGWNRVRDGSAAVDAANP